MRFYSVEVLGLKRERSPEGFLICYDVPIARTGLQIYGPEEVPVKPGPDGYIRIERVDGEVFRPETIASFEGKPVVNEHPVDDVAPHNYKQLTCGNVQNVRRGEGFNSDLLLADLLVMDDRAIRDIEAGKNQVSCGYDAEYDEIAPGHAVQRNIIGNHVALVTDARCGPRCAIGDHAIRVHAHDNARCGARLSQDASRTIKGGRRMPKIRDALARAFAARTKDELDAIANETEEGMGGGNSEDGLHLHVHHGGGRSRDDEELGGAGAIDPNAGLAERFEALEGQLQEMEADHHEMLDMLEELTDGDDDDQPEGEDTETSMDRVRDRIAKFRGASRDARGKAADRMRDVDARRSARHDKARDAVRRRLADYRRSLDAEGEEEKQKPEWLQKDRRQRDMAADVKDCGMDALRRHSRDLKRMKDEGSNSSTVPVSNANLEGSLEMEAPPGTADRARKARDSVYLEESWQETVALAEMIVPGQRYPTFDRATAPASTFDRLCKLRRSTLDLAHNRPEWRGDLDAAIGGDYAELSKKLTCDAARTLFRAVAVIARSRNNASGTRPHVHDSGIGARPGLGIGSIGALQTEINEFWDKQNKPIN